MFAIILVQSFLYVRAARRAAPDLDIPAAELTTAFRSGAIASVGPSLAVVIVAISLLALFGTPAVLVRIGLIGSAAFETGAAKIAAQSAGVMLLLLLTARALQADWLKEWALGISIIVALVAAYLAHVALVPAA